MNKIVIVINGKGEAGKDTICGIVSRHFRAVNVSSIDPIKEIARQNGWDGEKDNNSLLFLSNLKAAFSQYNDLPTRYLLSKYAEFMADEGQEIMFAHIREASEIARFSSGVSAPLMTLYIDRPGLGQYHNKSDDDADDFAYDHVYVNDRPLESLESDFMRFFDDMIAKV